MAILAAKQAIGSLLYRIGSRVNQLDPLKILRQVGRRTFGTTTDGAITVDLKLLHRHRQHDGLATIIYDVQTG